MLRSAQSLASVPDWHTELVGQAGDVDGKLLLVEEADEEDVREVGNLHRRARQEEEGEDSKVLASTLL